MKPPAVIGQLRFGSLALQPAARLLDGWAQPEPGFTWAIGHRSRFTIPVDHWPDGAVVLLELDLNPFVPPGSADGQRLSVAVNDMIVGDDVVRGEGIVGYRVPPAARRGAGDPVITLHMPQARRPVDLGLGTDGRQLGFMVRSAALRLLPDGPPGLRRMLRPLTLPSTRDAAMLAQALLAQVGLGAAALLGRFESLGHNCEFGIAQRHFGAEPVGLLRFCGVTLTDLLTGLDAGFDGVGEPEQIEIILTGGGRPEFMIRDTRHRLSLHTMRYGDEADAAEIGRDASRHLRYLHRKFIKTVRDGHKICVFQRPGQTLFAQALPLLARLQSLGPNALLFVTEGDDQPPGTVQELEHGLFRGWIDHAAPADDVGLCNLSAWLSLCANAQRLWDVQSGSFARPAAV